MSWMPFLEMFQKNTRFKHLLPLGKGEINVMPGAIPTHPIIAANCIIQLNIAVLRPVTADYDG